MLESITPLILTYNEAPNIERTLQELQWASRIVVVDSQSTDTTLDILKRYPQVEVIQRKFDTHANQWNFGLEQIQSEWVLSLDADYVLIDALINELKTLSPSPEIDGYFIPFKYCVFGKPLRGTILPPRQALFRKGRSHYIDDGHTQLLVVKGQSESLSNPIYHDDRKSLSRWLWAQHRYHEIETNKLVNASWAELNWADRIRTLKLFAPFLIFVYCFIFKRGFLDGWHGWYYVLQRVLAEIDIALHLMEYEISEKIKDKN